MHEQPAHIIQTTLPAPSSTPKAIHTMLFTTFPPLRALLLITLFCDLCVALLNTLQWFLLSLLLARVFLQHVSFVQLGVLPWLLLVSMGGHSLLSGAREVLTRHGALSLKAKLRQRIYAHLLRLGPISTQRERTGELATTLGEGVERLDAYICRYLPQLALSLVLPPFILLVVFPLDRTSALLLLLTAPILPLLLMLVGSSAEKQTNQQWMALTRMSAHFLDVVQGLSTLKLFGRAQEEQERVARISDTVRRKTMQTLRLAFLSGAVLDFLTAMAIGLVAVVLGVRLLTHNIALQNALFVLLLTPEFYRPLRELGAARHAGLEGKAAAARLVELLALPLSVREGATPTPAGTLEIAFHGVQYTYPGNEQPALREVALTLPVGTCTALVGESGAGKSTLARLLVRSIECEQGTITANTIPISEFSLAEWRRCVALVPQHPYLFCETVWENIRLARPAASEDDVRRAAELAGVLEFIPHLPAGFDTPVGERGARLSAGQAQRIAIARAFLKDAPLLILDEPTSSLDPESEQALCKVLTQLIRGRTVLLIAHRLNAVATADRIVLLEKGCLSEIVAPQNWLRDVASTSMPHQPRHAEVRR